MKKFGLLACCCLCIILVGLVYSPAYAGARTYTTDSDFDEGSLVGVEHETVHDQLQLSEETVTLPFIWVPNSNQGTVSKIDTETGRELGRYVVGRVSSVDPSRTTVDLSGSCWLGNRQAGTVVKIGLLEAGQYVDRNGNGTIETSRDLDDDGNISGAEILPWGQDECVLFEIVLVPGFVGTYVPGQYLGPYDPNYWGVSPRGLAVDANNNVWAGTWSTQKFYYIDGTSGAILRTVDVVPFGHSSYGAVVDANGIVWSSGSSLNHVLWFDPSAEPVTWGIVPVPHNSYGLGLDYNGHLFVSGWDYGALSRIDINTRVREWTKPALYQARGVAATSDNNIWIAASAPGLVGRYDNDGNLLATIAVGAQPTGVAVDAAGKVWACNLADEYVHRIVPTTNMVDLAKRVIGGLHYSYSDMTGMISRTITTKIGTWTVVYDCGESGMVWGTVSWTSDEPTGTAVGAKVRSSEDTITWSAWEVAVNGTPLSATPPGRYIQVEAKLQILEGDVSPVLFDLTIEPAVIYVSLDIKPTSCPNPLNTGSKGVLPVAILGTDDFDPTSIDPATLLLAGVPPLRWEYEDVAAPVDPEAEPCDCVTYGPDGYMDLTVKFSTQAIVAALGAVTDGEIRPLTITGSTFDGVQIEGTDCVRIHYKDDSDAPVVSTDPVDTQGTSVSLNLAEPTRVSLAIYDVRGRRVRMMIDGYLAAGAHTICWDGTDDLGGRAADGIYFCRVSAGAVQRTSKMFLVR